MECSGFEELLSAYADGEVSLEERGALAAHLRGCLDCRRELELLRTMKTAVKEAASPPIPETLSAALLQEARKQRGYAAGRAAPWAGVRRSLGLSWATLSFAAAAAAVLALRLSLGRAQDIPVDLMLVAHNEYALTMPLSPQELILSDLSMRLK